MSRQRISLFKRNLTFLRIFIFFVLEIAFLSAGAENALNVDIGIRIENILLEIEDAYQNKDTESIMSFIDTDFPNYYFFKKNLRDNFFKVSSAKIFFVVDSCLKKDGMILIKLHWFRKIIKNHNRLFKTQGTSEFIFKEYTDPDKKEPLFKLYQIKGDNPFY